MEPITKRQFLESIVKHEISADDMQQLDNIAGGNLAAVADIAERANVNRRDFLKYSSLAALMAGIAVASNNCGGGAMGLSNIQETGPVHYPKLPGHKIQSPEHYGLEGCMVGYFCGKIFGTSRPFLAEKLNKKEIEGIIDNYEKKLAKIPTIMMMSYAWTRLSEGGNDFPAGQAAGAAEKSIIPFITYDLRSAFFGDRMEFSLSDISNGKADHLLKDFAQQSRKFGEQYGGFFIRTMREMNLAPWDGLWGRSPSKFKKTWKHIWHIFNEEGANEYATWVWNPVPVFWSPSRSDRNLEYYYPDDKFVDWIGLNAYSHSGSEYFTRMLGPSIRRLHKSHPAKPMMIAEYGIEEHGYKPKYVKDVFEELKKEYHEIKALVWWDMNWSNKSGGVDSRIDSTPEALKAFKEAIADPYFLGKVPYREDLKNKA